MKNLLILALIGFFTNNAIAANGSGNVSNAANTSSYGATAATSTASVPVGIGNGLFSLFLSYSSASSDYFYPFVKNGTIYQVPSGKSAYCFNITAQDSTTAGTWQLVYNSSAASITGTASGSYAGVTYQSGVSTSSSMAYQQQVSAYNMQSYPGFFVFPANQYPGAQVHHATTQAWIIHMDCFEQ